MAYETKIHSLIIKPTTEPIFSEQATIVGIEDEAAGIFFTLEQQRTDGKVSFDSKEWLAIVDAVERLRSDWADSL
jgi:hypothetical protein